MFWTVTKVGKIMGGEENRLFENFNFYVHFFSVNFKTCEWVQLESFVPHIQDILPPPVYTHTKPNTYSVNIA